MKKIINILILIILSLITVFITKNFIDNDVINFAIVFGCLSFVSILLTISYIVRTRSDKAIYESFIKNKLVTYDSVMVGTEELPNLSGKVIMKINKFGDLIDAQLELKKPIYYKKYNDYTVFILLDNKEACVCIVKLNENQECEYEEELDKIIKDSLKNDLDRSLLEDIDKTTIIRLDKEKEFRVSPIRKNGSNEFTPKRYYIRKNNIFCTLSDDSEKKVFVRDIKDIVKVFDNDNRLRNITISTDEYKFILKDTSEMDLEEVENRLLSRIAKVNNGLKIREEVKDI